MEFKQIYTPGLAHCSYVIGGKEYCLVVDPAREVTQYINIAESLGLKIKAIIETHLHADFVSGHTELAMLTGADIYISRKAGAAFLHHALEDEEIFRVDTLLVKMLETPGHTPEGTVFTVADLERGPEPILMFSGDTLLVGDVGRPDLFPDIKEELASELYHSLRRLEKLADHMEIYPAHGAGSLCGRSLSSKLSSTVGTERLYNGAINIHPEAEFMNQLLEDMPEAPDHFSRCSEINRQGPAITVQLPKPVGYSPQEFLQLIESGHLVVDTRDQLPFAAAHIPGAYGLSLKGNFATFSGWVLPPDKPLLLVVDDIKALNAALLGLRSVGLDNVLGYLEGGMGAWAESGYKTSGFACISIMELKDLLDKNEILLIDTRLKGEYEEKHIAGSIHVPAPDVRYRYQEWKGEKPVAFICNTGNRSLLACSLMQRSRADAVIFNVLGGTKSWADMGLPMVNG
ncbi:metallo-beta-lactamase family protein [hydrocarbon metagenome]|uniref:Metallo-beta-lactamase family protein n=1 Tax=hydrocarbon metagenome TaxID=938273 RepID=A0A0W8E6L0_9ZZZZ